MVKVNGQNVRKYSISYTNSPSTFRSLIAQVTEYGTDFSSALPPMKFSYQTKPFSFGPLTDWPGVYGQGTNIADWHSVRSQNANGETRTDLLDMDRDGLPDRVMRQLNTPYDRFQVQFNTGSGFTPASYDWRPVDGQGDNSGAWRSPRQVNANRTTTGDLIDINGDGLPDRVMRKRTQPFDSYWVVQTNTGLSGASAFSAPFNWGPVTLEAGTEKDEWCGVRDGTDLGPRVDILDMNGDGLPDRVLRKPNQPYTYWKVQLNTGAGFSGLLTWTNVNSQGNFTNVSWNNIYSNDGDYDSKTGLWDINGDGLPDRVMRNIVNQSNPWVVQFNNGTGFEAPEPWGGSIDGQGQPGDGWYSPTGSDGVENFAVLADINGDGLLDRVMRQATGSPVTTWKVQFNTGTGFTYPATTWTGVNADDNGQNWRTVTTTRASGNSTTDFLDINGDGLPDRVMRQVSNFGTLSTWRVQLNNGPFPDLMSGIDNSMGGAVQIRYAPSTQYSNRVAGLSLLAAPMWTVSQVIVDDGVDHTGAAALTNSYAYESGMYDYPTKEFRGFGKVTAIDPVGGKTITYFHQGGGTNGTAWGEFQDAGSRAKKGMPYRVEVYGAPPNTNLYSVTINKVEESEVITGKGWFFARVTQTVQKSYEGLSGVTPRATLKLYEYDPATGDITKESNLGEIQDYVESTHAYTEKPGDEVYTQTSYITLANGARKPDRIRTTDDSNGTVVLRETKFTYDSKGNLLTHLRWLGGANYATNSVSYDAYGNPTSATDAANNTTYTTYDLAYQMFPERTITGTFTNKTQFDARSGSILSTTNAAGLVAVNLYDAFLRLTNTLISTAPFGPATLWRTRTTYNLGDARLGTLYIHQQTFDPNDPNGVESRTYMDGFGRSIQTRAEAEGASGRVRVVDRYYDKRGKVEFQTLPYIETSGWSYGANGASKAGSFTAFDPIGRPSMMVSPATISGVALGDTGSPVGSNTIAYVEGTTLWRTLTTDALGNTRKADHDAYGRIIRIIEPLPDGGTTTFDYDKVGNLTQVTDAAGNITRMFYDQLGAKTNMIDPDMGTWSYSYDAARRLIEQTDANGQKIKFYYENGELGRLVRKELYNSTGALVTNVTYVYDTNLGDNNYTVFKGQLFMVSDRQGWQKSSYDIRGRVLKTTRYLTVTGTQYDIVTAYDDADRVITNTYPGNVTRLTYSYDNVGHLTNITSVCGTLGNHTFYSLPVFDDLDRLVQYQYGNGITTVVSNYTNSRRLYGLRAHKAGADVQNLTYTYNAVGHLLSITDNKYTGTASASLSGITYDKLYRLSGYTRFGNPATFTYNAIGNMLSSSEGPAGAYNYPSAGSARPHAVASIGSTKTYAYDACGNMTNRNGWVLRYDEENQLTQIVGT